MTLDFQKRVEAALHRAPVGNDSHGRIHQPVCISRGSQGYVFMAYEISDDDPSKFGIVFVKVPHASTHQADTKLIENEEAHLKLLANISGIPLHPHQFELRIAPDETVTALRTASDSINVYDAVPVPLSSLRKRFGIQSVTDYRNWLKLADSLSIPLIFMHERGIAHCDIKESNIVLSSILGNWRGAYLVDFGASVKMDHPPRHRTGTPKYWPPSVIINALAQYDPLAQEHPEIRSPRHLAFADRFALGIVLAKLALGTETVEEALSNAEASPETGDLTKLLGESLCARHPELSSDGSFARLWYALHYVTHIKALVRREIKAAGRQPGFRIRALRLCNDSLLRDEHGPLPLHTTLSRYHEYSFSKEIHEGVEDETNRHDLGTVLVNFRLRLEKARSELETSSLLFPITEHAPPLAGQLATLSNHQDYLEAVENSTRYCERDETPPLFPMNVREVDATPYIDQALDRLRNGRGVAARERLQRILDVVFSTRPVELCRSDELEKIVTASRVYIGVLCPREGLLDEALEMLERLSKFVDAPEITSGHPLHRGIELAKAWHRTLSGSIDVFTQYREKRRNQAFAVGEALPPAPNKDKESKSSVVEDDRLRAWTTFNKFFPGVRSGDESLPELKNIENTTKSQTERVAAILLQVSALTRSKRGTNDIFSDPRVMRTLLKAAASSMQPRFLPWEYARCLKKAGDLVHRGLRHIDTNAGTGLVQSSPEDSRLLAVRCLDLAADVFFRLGAHDQMIQCCEIAARMLAESGQTELLTLAFRYATLTRNLAHLDVKSGKATSIVAELIEIWREITGDVQPLYRSDPGLYAEIRYYDRYGKVLNDLIGNGNGLAVQAIGRQIDAGGTIQKVIDAGGVVRKAHDALRKAREKKRWSNDDPPTSSLGQPTKFLDVGCGLGVDVINARAYYDRVEGIDASAWSIQKSRNRLALEPDDAVTFHDPVDIGSFRGEEDDGSYDTILAHDTLSYIADKPRAIQRIFELLKPGGFLLLTDLVHVDITSPLDFHRVLKELSIAGIETARGYQEMLWAAGFHEHIEVVEDRDQLAAFIELVRKKATETQDPDPKVAEVRHQFDTLASAVKKTDQRGNTEGFLSWMLFIARKPAAAAAHATAPPADPAVTSSPYPPEIHDVRRAIAEMLQARGSDDVLVFGMDDVSLIQLLVRHGMRVHVVEASPGLSGERELPHEEQLEGRTLSFRVTHEDPCWNCASITDYFSAVIVGKPFHFLAEPARQALLRFAHERLRLHGVFVFFDSVSADEMTDVFHPPSHRPDGASASTPSSCLTSNVADNTGYLPVSAKQLESYEDMAESPFVASILSTAPRVSRYVHFLEKVFSCSQYFKQLESYLLDERNEEAAISLTYTVFSDWLHGQKQSIMQAVLRRYLNVISSDGGEDFDGLYNPDVALAMINSYEWDSDADGAIRGLQRQHPVTQTKLQRIFGAICDSFSNENVPRARGHMASGDKEMPR